MDGGGLGAGMWVTGEAGLSALLTTEQATPVNV